MDVPVFIVAVISNISTFSGTVRLGMGGMGSEASKSNSGHFGRYAARDNPPAARLHCWMPTVLTIKLDAFTNIPFFYIVLLGHNC